MLSNSKYLGLQMADAIHALERALLDAGMESFDSVEVRFTVMCGARKFGVRVDATKEMLEAMNGE